MALYKPSNFYPNMDEVDLEKEEGQEFECKINANGSEVNAYKMEILSEDGVQLYEAYQNLDTPLKNDDFLTVKVKPFILKNNITEVKMDWQLSNWLGEYYWLESQYIKIDKPFIKIVGNFDITENVYPDDLYYAITNNDSYDGTTIEEYGIQKQINEGKIDFTIDVSKYLGKYFYLAWFVYVKDGFDIDFNNITDDELNSIKNNLSNFYIHQIDNGLSNLQFQSIEQQPYDLLSTYCPYNLWKINIDNLYNFKAKLYKEGQELITTGIKRFNYNYEDKTYDIEFENYNISNIIEYDEIKIYLANDFNYKWNIRLYEHKLDKINSTEFKNNTYITDGYLVGTTGGTCLSEAFYKNNKLLDINDNADNYNYLQFEFSEENSNFFKKEILEGLSTKGYVQNINDLLNDASKFYNFNLTAQNYYVAYSKDAFDRNMLPQLKENDAMLDVTPVVYEPSSYKDGWGGYMSYAKRYCYKTTNFKYYNSSKDFSELNNIGGFNAQCLSCSNINFECDNEKNGFFVYGLQTDNYGNEYNKQKNIQFKVKIPLYSQNDEEIESYGNNFCVVLPIFYDSSERYVIIESGQISIEFEDDSKNYFSLPSENFSFDFRSYNSNRGEFYPKSGFGYYVKNISCPDYFNNKKDMIITVSFTVNVKQYLGYHEATCVSVPNINVFANGQFTNELLLQDNFVNFNLNNNNNNYYLDFKIYNSEDLLLESRMNKIDSYNFLSKKIILNNNNIMEKLKYFNSNNNQLKMEYQLKYYQRIKIYDWKNILYVNKHFSKFVIDEDMNYIPVNNSTFYLNDYNNLYNKTTVNVPKKNEVSTDKYIRFPTVDRITHLNYYINSNNGHNNLAYLEQIYVLELNTDYFVAFDKNSMTILNDDPIGVQPRKNYTNVPEDELKDDTNVFCLHKIIGWDPDTNEIRFENELERELEWYDTYEIWEKVINSADLKGAYYKKLTDPLKIDNYWTYSQSSNIINNNSNELFVQPNINMKSDKYYMPQLIFNNKVYNIKYNFNTITGLLFEDNSLFNIENSQYRLKPVEMVNDILNLEWYKVNSGFIDSSPENYFYAKDRVELNVTAIALFDNIETLKTIPLVYGENNEISGLDFKFIGSINNSTIKRYRYQMFESNTGMLVYDSNYLYDDKLEMYIQGLIPDCGYVLVLEVETDFGLIYKQDYDLTNKMEYVNIVEEGGINRNWCTSKNTTGCLMYANGLALPMGNTIDEDIVYNNNLMIYKYDNISPKWDYVATIDNTDTQVIMDYNIRNDNAYQYVAVGSDYDDNNNINKYKFYKFNPAKTCFNTYIISDIYKIKDGFYEVGESWNLKYNLENSDVTSNFGVTQHDTMGRYGTVTYDKKNYDSGTITCLLGDIIENSYTETELNNNMRKLLRWKEFITNGNLKLLKDIKGNKWIVNTVENPSVKFNNNSNNVVMSTVSFQWIEVMNSDNITITNTCTLEEFAEIENTSAFTSASVSSFGNKTGNVVVAQNTLNSGDIVIGAGDNRIRTLDGIIFDGGSGE